MEHGNDEEFLVRVIAVAVALALIAPDLAILSVLAGWLGAARRLRDGGVVSGMSRGVGERRMGSGMSSAGLLLTGTCGKLIVIVLGFSCGVQIDCGCEFSVSRCRSRAAETGELAVRK